MMGLGYTLQQLEGWQGQYDRVARWLDRVKVAANGSTSPDELDFLLAFFENCFHLRDWLRSDGAVTQTDVETLFETSAELKLCRDIANGFKHASINRPSIDARFSIINEYVPQDWPGEYRFPNGKWIVCWTEGADTYQYGLVQLAEKCFQTWRVFMKDKKLHDEDSK